MWFVPCCTEHLKKFCSDPATVATETPAECCQDQRQIRNVKYLSCDHTRASRKLLGGDDGAGHLNLDHCREVMQPDNVYDANLRYKIKSGVYPNRMKFIKDDKGSYAGVLDSYNDMPVDLQTGKMCVFLQSTKPQPKVGIHLAGIRAKGDSQESPYMNCYSKKGAASYSYVDVNYAKGDEYLSMPLTYDYFDYMGDSYIKASFTS